MVAGKQQTINERIRRRSDCNEEIEDSPERKGRGFKNSVPSRMAMSVPDDAGRSHCKDRRVETDQLTGSINDDVSGSCGIPVPTPVSMDAENSRDMAELFGEEEDAFPEGEETDPLERDLDTRKGSSIGLSVKGTNSIALRS